MSASDCPATEIPDVLRAALARAEDGVVIVDDAHRITHFNPAAERIWKLAATEVLGRNAAVLTLKCLEARRDRGFPRGDQPRAARRQPHQGAGVDVINDDWRRDPSHRVRTRRHS
ncbi:PAS domain S-box protein [Bradyrhizobium sp. USDA 241]|uniref:PAS domain S-box protein n=1 Tax=Bradyrhizobium sp. USDA 241 TaxID=3377725 RepID=UPI003C77A807